MNKNKIIRNGKLYELIGTVAKEERTSANTIQKRIEGGMHAEIERGHVYVNREDFREAQGKCSPPAKPEHACTLVIGGKACHPYKWYMGRNAVSRAELADLPNTLVGGVRYVAEDDFRGKYWWMEV